MDIMVSTYLVYVAISIALTVWVGRTLNKNGRVFLVDNFEGSTELADSVNHLLLVGFYLINFGFVLLALKSSVKPSDTVGAIELLSAKIGIVIIVLGCMHFFNMFALARYRRYRRLKNEKNTDRNDAEQGETHAGDDDGIIPNTQPAT